VAESKLSWNPLSIAGAALTTLSAVLFLLSSCWRRLASEEPYAGLIGYVLLPLIFTGRSRAVRWACWREARAVAARPRRGQLSISDRGARVA
jgi:hypothetical protein